MHRRTVLLLEMRRVWDKGNVSDIYAGDIVSLHSDAVPSECAPVVSLRMI